MEEMGKRSEKERKIISFLLGSQRKAPAILRLAASRMFGKD